MVNTLASAVVTVAYDYVPSCPKPTGIIRFGVHRQQTQLVVSFNGPANPTDAQNPANYTITASPGAVPIKIASATYNSQKQHRDAHPGAADQCAPPFPALGELPLL